METLFRITALSLTAAVIGLLLRRKNAELTSLLSMAAIAVSLMSALRLADGFRELTGAVRSSLGGGETLLLPVLKCLACAIVTRIGAELCRDASQNALAAAVELAGALCALGISLPLILSLLKRIGALL